MSMSLRILLVGAAGVLVGAGAVGVNTLGAGSTQAQGARTQGSQVIGNLGENEGLYVDLKEFKVHKGRVGKKDSGKLAMVDAREVSEGAVIVRSGGKLYIVDTKPQASTPQAMKDFWDSMPLPMR